MVYDNTLSRRTPTEILIGGPSGFVLTSNAPIGGDTCDEYQFSIYSDDGHGNGDFVCAGNELDVMRRIAHALDFSANERATIFDALVAHADSMGRMAMASDSMSFRDSWSQRAREIRELAKRFSDEASI